MDDDDNDGSVGVIEMIDDDGVAWGMMRNGQTFDLPTMGNHVVGDEVRLRITEEDEFDEDDSLISHYAIIVGNTKATYFALTETDEGFEITDVHVFDRQLN